MAATTAAIQWQCNDHLWRSSYTNLKRIPKPKTWQELLSERILTASIVQQHRHNYCIVLEFLHLWRSFTSSLYRSVWQALPQWNHLLNRIKIWSSTFKPNGEREREREGERSIQGSWSFFDIITSIFLYPTARRPSCCQGLLLLLLLPRRETLATRRTEEKRTAAAGINTGNNKRRNILDPSMKGAVGFHRDKSVRATDRQTADRRQPGSAPPSLSHCLQAFFLSFPFWKRQQRGRDPRFTLLQLLLFLHSAVLLHLVLGKSTCLVVVVVVA